MTAVIVSALASCVTGKLRLPNSGKDPVVLFFNRSPENVDRHSNYRFLLIDLEKLSQRKIDFHAHHVRDRHAAKEVAKWIEQLRIFTEKSEKKSEFTAKNLKITVKRSSLETFLNALDLLSQRESDSDQLLRKQIELITAFNNNFNDPIERGMGLDLALIVFQFFDRLSDIQIRESTAVVQVQPSSVWTDRSQQKPDMMLGAGSEAMVEVMRKFQTQYGKTDLSDSGGVCDYVDAKRGYGVHLGFKIKCFDKNFKLKLGEAKGGPLDSKLYYRLGYNVPGIFYLKQINVKYDRHILTESDARKTQYIKMRLAGVPIVKVKVPRESDMQNEISYAVLNDGTKISSDQLMKQLIPNCADPKCHFNDSLYDSEFEKQISYLGFNEVAILEDNNDFEFGSWSYDDLDHRFRTEINNIAFLGAITGNVDLRKDNNRLIWNKKTGEIQHTLSDPGRGLGKGTIFHGAFNINKFPWDVIVKSRVRDENSPTGDREYYAIRGYKPFMKHKSFKQIDLAEARWMARQFATISEDEWTEALITSGFSMAEMLILREKFISKQKNMVEVLGLGAEFPALMNREINRRISYRPTGVPVTVTLSNGRSYVVQEEGKSLENGILKASQAEIPAEAADEGIAEFSEIEF